jgi:hypothetical protein
MVPEDLLFWIAPLRDAPEPDANVLCRRHADAMVVPRGWTLDDRREAAPRLFRPAPSAAPESPPRVRARRTPPATHEQLQIDGTGEIPRPSTPDAPVDADADAAPDARVDAGEPDPWQPEFDAADDLDGLLEVNSPLLARAFRGTDRPKR